MLTGQNGILNRATEARVKQSNAQITDTVGLKYSEYQMEEKISPSGSNFMEYMQNKGYISSDGVINTQSLSGNKLPLGNGSGKKDVYVLESTENGYVVNYYDENGNKDTEVWNATGSSSSDTPSDNATKRDENMFEFDATTGTILRVKKEYVVDYYNYENWYTYFNSDYKWCKIEDGIDTLVIPNSINGVDVKSVASLGVINVKNIIIEEGILEISGIGSTVEYYSDDENYNRDSELENISIPSSVIHIGDCAFANCPKLIKINIPTGVTNIGKGAFKKCTGLTSIDIPTNVTSIGGSAFSGCTGLTSIDIPINVTSIGDDAFDGCTGLTSIDIPTSVTSIGSFAFSGCTGLISVNIPTSVTSIGSYAFRGCTGLTSINIPVSVTNMGYGVFLEWTSSQTINCQAKSKPSGWDNNWKGYGSEAKEKWGVSM